jgi:hypothetical protein
MTKKQILLTWVAKFGFSTSIILQEVLGIENKRVRNLIYELSATHKKGIPTIPSLKRVEVSGLQGQVLYMLTEAGLAEATRANAQDYRYSFKVSEMINFELLLHSLGVQFICARLFVKSGEKDVSGITPERLISAESGEKRPDALIFRNGEITAIEYERTEKSGDRLDRFFQEIEAKILQKKYPIFLIYTEIEGITQRYRNHLKSPFTRWKVGEKSRKWEAISKKPLAEGARGKIFIQTLREIQKATQPISYGIAKKESKK